LPAKYGLELQTKYNQLGDELVKRVRQKLQNVFPEEPKENTRPDGYLYARTITCPYCSGLIPLSPNWKLAPDGTGVRLKPNLETRTCEFEIVSKAKEQSEATVTRGDALCPYADCRRVVTLEEIKQQAKAGEMGEQLFAIVYKEKITTTTKTGRSSEKWVRGYRAPQKSDDNSDAIKARLAEKLV